MILLFQSLIAVAMVLYGTIDSLIDFFSFTAWIFYGGAMLALIVMRYTKPHAPRPYKVTSNNYISSLSFIVQSLISRHTLSITSFEIPQGTNVGPILLLFTLKFVI